jgi:dipeptidase
MTTGRCSAIALLGCLLAAAEGKVWHGQQGYKMAEGCTSVVVGHEATTNAATVTSHTNDCLNCDFRLAKVPAADYDEGSTRPAYSSRDAYPRFLGEGRGENYLPENTDTSPRPEWVGASIFDAMGTIPQVEHTYAYLDGGYAIMNEHQVSMGESTCGGRITALPVSKGGKALADVRFLNRVALERCSTALCAVEMMGAMAEELGYYGADATAGEAGESMQVTDPTDAWVFHIMADDTGTSAVWVAQRVPPNHIAIVANQFIIRKVDLSDTENFRGSSNMHDVAIRTGLWNPDTDGEFDFLATFGLSRGFMSPYATRRVWRIMTLAAPNSNLPADTTVWGDDYPFSIEVEGKLDVQDIISMHRDYYQGTEFDMSKSVSGGPYGDMSRFDPADTTQVYAEVGEEGITAAESTSGKFERAISIYRCSYSWVSQSRAGQGLENLGHIWFGQYAPHASGYVPVYVAGEHVPPSLASGSLYAYDEDVSYWVHAAVGNWADRFFILTIDSIRALQNKLEGELHTSLPALEAAAAALFSTGDDAAANELLQDFSHAASFRDTKEWRDFFYFMITKFKDGQRIDDFHAETLAPTSFFYPRWWLELVGFWVGGPLDVQGEAIVEETTASVPGFSYGFVLATNVAVGAACVVGTVLYTRTSSGSGYSRIEDKPNAETSNSYGAI